MSKHTYVYDCGYNPNFIDLAEVAGCRKKETKVQELLDKAYKEFGLFEPIKIKDLIEFLDGEKLTISENGKKLYSVLHVLSREGFLRKIRTYGINCGDILTKGKNSRRVVFDPHYGRLFLLDESTGVLDYIGRGSNINEAIENHISTKGTLKGYSK